MKLRGSLSTLLILVSILLMGQSGEKEGRAYRLTNEKGKTIGYKGLVERASEADIVFFGELHDDPIGHWLQLRLTRSLYEEAGDSLELGAEMFEAPDQLILDEYLEGTARMKDLKRTAKLWDNFDTDYKPLLIYARKKGIPFLASNVPRRYAALVHRKGLSALDSLSEEACSYMAEDFELDTGLASYQRIMKMGHGSNGKRIAQAQALKDATMAERIRKRYDEGETFLHFNGSFHSDAHEGIVHYLEKELSKTDVLVISSLKVADLQDPKGVKWERKGDVNLLVPEDMTSTH
ncbi:MAG: ChaN family lipoprotein [Flavobacteriales bacterium]